ncbi:CynX/NimT family MFS transporter [Kitasatospora aureofaciens]|uniref:Transporter n=1 Tax=Kitasatospora aureofaciens TaxID=1894 RepID=A0A1E7N0P6_KITAU|nr:MFS transporter [Kitasatospora aureofaciens]QEV03839.1 MFS transporter [Streptomyces viridifaciens]ARF82603.1 MFS transporter [Kitasatospora aureofaciens]OEV34259.1 transporter [Kitasatospora aureofaciens]UKZ05437.1 MFS transporter [Streptomyces viridifaciens]GGU81438.1 MFS transporter [Kitasatospora aureofaciens]
MPPAADTTASPRTGARPQTERPSAPAKYLGVLFAVAIAAAAVNLRPVVTSLGPLLDPVRADLGMSSTLAGLLAAVPALCFALFGFLAPAAARRIGPIAVITAGMGAITAGVLARSFAGGTAVFLLLTALALAGVAVSNVLLPVVIKRYFPEKVGPMIGLYSMALSAGTALAALVSVPLTSALGGDWRYGLGVWAGLGALALVLWLPVLIAKRERGERAGSAGAPAKLPITRSRTAWAMAGYFGLQATGAYVVMGFLSKIFQDSGIDKGTSGALLAVTMVIGVPVSFVLPNLAARRGDQRLFVVVLASFGIAGYAGLAFAPAGAPWVWAVLVGLSNCAFPLVLTMIGLRARTAGGVAQLSVFAQGVGYLISIPGPILVGWIYQATGRWYGPLGFLALLLVPQMLFGLRAARARHIEDEAVHHAERVRA